MNRRCVVSCLITLFVSLPAAKAYTPTPGTTALGVLLAPSFKFGGGVESDASLLGQLEVEYAVQSDLGVVFDLGVGIAQTVPLRLGVGGRWRYKGLSGPLSPFLQGHVAGGRFFGPGNRDLNFLGLRLGAGVDFYLTGNIAVGGLFSVEVDRTLGSVGDNIALFDTTLRVLYRF